LDRAEDGSIENPDVAAPRELAEETGHRAATWRRLGSFYTAPGFATELMHLYLATDLTPIADYAGPDVDERLDLRRVPVAEAVRMAEDGGINDAKSIAGLFWLQRLIDRGEVRL
jgi:ADP-ribose pyrophosphatase